MANPSDSSDFKTMKPLITFINILNKYDIYTNLILKNIEINPIF